MIKRILTVFAVSIVLALTLGLAGCGAPDATGYLGDLEDGSSFTYIQIGDGDTMISIIDDEHQGDDADTYTGKAATDANGKITVTDKETGKTIAFTMVENSDGTYDVDVEGHGKGTLKPYEGNLMEVIGAMADDDAEEEK